MTKPRLKFWLSADSLYWTLDSQNNNMYWHTPKSFMNLTGSDKLPNDFVVAIMINLLMKKEYLWKTCGFEHMSGCKYTTANDYIMCEDMISYKKFDNARQKYFPDLIIKNKSYRKNKWENKWVQIQFGLSKQAARSQKYKRNLLALWRLAGLLDW